MYVKKIFSRFGLYCFFEKDNQKLFFFFLVRLFGIEDRLIDRFVVFRDEIFEYIIFRGSDIKDFYVCELLKVQFL